MRAAPPVCPEPFAGKRLIHEAEHGLAIVDEADQRPPERTAHDKGARTVDGIQDPLVAAGARHGGEFLAKDAVIRETFRDGGTNGALSSPIGGRYRVVPRTASLVLHNKGMPEIWKYGRTGKLS